MPFNLGIMEVAMVVVVLGTISTVVAVIFGHLLHRSTRNDQLEARVRELEDRLEERHLHEQLRRPD